MDPNTSSTAGADTTRAGRRLRMLWSVLPLIALILFGGRLAPAGATTAAPAAPVPLSPVAGASVTVPFTITWSVVSDPAGIAAYNWEVSPSSTFASVIRNGSTSGATQDTVSGLAKGTYFWHVQAVDGNLVDSPWSSPQSFTVTGASSSSPGTPTLNAPQGGTNQFHPFETITWTWSAVPGAASYLFEVSQDPAFPVSDIRSTVTTTGTTIELTDEAIGNWQARVSAVDANGIGGVPSKTQSFSISYNAPLPAPPTPLSPVDGATVSLPVTLSWTQVPNPQPQGYEVQIATDSGFQNVEDDIPLITPNNRQELSLTAGTKFWRVRSFQGDNSPTTAAVTAWSSTASFVVADGPTAVTGIELTRTPSAFSGDDEQMRIQLNHAAPAGGTTVTLTSSDPTAAPVPASTTLAEGFALSPAPILFDFGQVTVPTPVTITASTGSSSFSVSLTVEPPSLGSLTMTPSITGGSPLGATLLLNGTAPPGAVVSLASDDPAVQLPATVAIAAGSGSAQFTVQTGAVAANTTATVTASWNGGSVSSQITLTPQVAPGSIAVSPAVTVGTSGANGTVTLAAPADHDVQILLTSSDPSIASVPPTVTVPQFAGGGGFEIATTPPAAPTTVTITASGAGVTVTATLTVDPFPTGPTGPAAASLSLSPATTTGGGTSTATVALSAAAPAGGTTVTLGSNLAAATVPASVTVPAGATSATFTVTTQPVSGATTATISASAGGSTQTAALSITPATAPADTLSITKAEYAAGNAQLTVEATGTSAAATLRVYVTSSGALVGPLVGDGSGRFKGQFSWPSYPQSITVESTLGGATTRAVTLK